MQSEKLILYTCFVTCPKTKCKSNVLRLPVSANKWVRITSTLDQGQQLSRTMTFSLEYGDLSLDVQLIMHHRGMATDLILFWRFYIAGNGWKIFGDMGVIGFSCRADTVYTFCGNKVISCNGKCELYGSIRLRIGILISKFWPLIPRTHRSMS